MQVSSRVALYRLLRWLLVRTSLQPLTSLYRLAYGTAQYLAVAALRRQPGVRAIYARRGMARGNIQPGISDIDMMLVSDYSLAQNPTAYRKYLRLAKLIPLLEKNIMCHAASVLQQEYERRAILRYAWNDGRSSMRLLWGDDLMAALQTRAQGPQPEAMTYGVTMTWQVTTRNFLERDLPREDPILSVSVAYRSIADLLRSQQRLLEQGPDADRETVLSQHAAATAGGTGEFLKALCASAAHGYRNPPADLAAQTLTFVFDECRRALGRLADSSFASGPPCSATVDAPTEECVRPQAVDNHLRLLASLARSAYGSRYRGIAAAPTLFHKPPSWVAVIDIDLSGASLLGLSTVQQAHQQAAATLPEPVHLYLLTSEGALSLGHQVHRVRAEPLLLPYVHLDVFQLLARPESQVDGICIVPSADTQVTPALRSVLQESLWVATNRSHVPAVQEWARRRPVSDFWWIIQLRLLEVSIENDEPHFAVTPAAVERRLQQIGRPLPEGLRPLRRVASPAPPEAAALLPKAADYLEGLLGDRADEFQLVLDSWRGKPTISDWAG